MATTTESVKAALDFLKARGGAAQVVESGKTDDTWYRVWSDGLIEQGGTLAIKKDGYSGGTITFPKPFTKITYSITCHHLEEMNTASIKSYAPESTTLTLASFNFRFPELSGRYGASWVWKASGY